VVSGSAVAGAGPSGVVGDDAGGVGRGARVEVGEGAGAGADGGAQGVGWPVNVFRGPSVCWV
jgi:hypothetical protein